MNKLLASLMLIVAGVVAAQNIATVTTLDPSQVYSTGNLVNNTTNPTNVTSTWQNVGLMNQGLPCWAPGDPGCGPQPYFNNGSFNFSWGVTDVHQYVNIAAALPNAGTGLRVNGYNFGFTAKNGNGWDGGGLDTLSAYVTFYGSDGKTVRHDYYDLNYVFNWTTFNLNKTFDTPYANKDLSNVRYGFIGGDTSNYWAGPYGPEIYNINFSLKYSVDPCYNNPLYSPTCPGYMDALNKLLPPPSSTSATTTSTTTTPTTTITTTVIDDPVNPTVTVTSTPTAATTTTSTAASSTTTASSTAAAPTAAAQKSTVASSGTSAGLSVIARNQQREQNIVNAAVQNAIGGAESAATASQQEAMAVASAAVTNSVASAIALTSQPGLGIGMRSSGVGLQFGLSSMQNNDFGSTESVISNRGALLDRTNPLNEYVEQKPAMSSGTVSAGPAVNRNTADNEAAGGVNIAKMAIAPQGYNDYLNLTLRDAAFYAPKEVYKNQRNVDNARALRQLTNDSRHREMVEQQYRSQP